MVARIRISSSLGTLVISVGATIDFALIADDPGRIAGLVVLLVAVKFAVVCPRPGNSIVSRHHSPTLLAGQWRA